MRAINTLNPPPNYIRKLRGLSPIHSTRWCRAQALMWGARRPFLPAAAMVVAVVKPVVFCAKATEKRNKNTKISWWLPKGLFITICYKTYCNSYIANSVCVCFWAIGYEGVTVKHALTSTSSPPNDIPSIPWSPVVLPLWTPWLGGLARAVSNGLVYLGCRTPGAVAVGQLLNLGTCPFKSVNTRTRTR